MSALDLPANDMPSPCVKVCVMDSDRGVCLGCYRTLDEIGGWSAFNSAQKLAVLARIGERVRRWGPPTPPAGGVDGTGR